jgi:hypothetical protein
MKKVKFIASIASEEFSYKPGDVTSLETPVANAWAENGLVVILEDEKPKK